MERTDNRDACQPARLKATDSSISRANSTDEAKVLPEKMKKIEIKPPPSPTSFLARNAVLLPSQVARLKQINPVEGGLQVGATASALPVSSGSATGSLTASLSSRSAPPLLLAVPVSKVERFRASKSLMYINYKEAMMKSPLGNPRNKTALAPGHSLMDWIRLGSSGVDLTGVGGVTRNVTPKELAKHNKKNDAWIAIRGIVFNVTRYMDFHPGGVSELMRGVGKDATKLFDDVHAWVNYQSILQKCVVGRLTRGGAADVADKSINTSANLSLSRPATVSSSESSKARPEVEKVKQPSSTSRIQVDWKQTTNSLSFIYKPSSEQHSTGYRLTRLNDAEFVVKIHTDNTVIRHDYDLSSAVSWPPTLTKRFESAELELSFTKSTGKLWESYGSRSVGVETKSNERTYREYEVVSNTTMCEGVHLLVVRSNDYVEVLPVGRHVEAKMIVMGMEVSRSYTPVPPSLHPDHMAPGYKTDCLCLMVKRYEDGALSPSITELESGQVLTLSNGLGTFVVESFDDCPTIHMLAAGTGLTPMLGIIQRALSRRNVRTINLVNFNRTEDNIFYRSQLDRVCLDGKLKVVHVLSQPGESWTGRRGLVSQSLLKEIVGTSTKQSCVFICGPKTFMSVAKETLKKLDWKTSQMHAFDG